MLTKDEFLIATRELFSALYDSAASRTIDYRDLAASIDLSKLGEHFSASEIASEICASDIADHVDLGDIADEVAEKIDPRDVARHLSVDTGEIIDELNYRKLAAAIIAELRGHT